MVQTRFNNLFLPKRYSAEKTGSDNLIISPSTSYLDSVIPYNSSNNGDLNIWNGAKVGDTIAFVVRGTGHLTVSCISSGVITPNLLPSGSAAIYICDDNTTNANIWRCLGIYRPGASEPVVTTASALADIGDAINTKGKFHGRWVEDESGNWFRAAGTTAGAVWKTIDGGSDVTPT